MIVQYKSKMLVEVAKLYYQHQLSQEQIARKIRVSRPTISRLLQQARDTGIVKIEIIDSAEASTQLESALVEKYKIKHAIVVPNDSGDNKVLKKHLGKAAVVFIDKLVSEEIVLGISWGTTMQEVAKQIQPRNINDMIVVQLNGGISRAELDTHASEIAKTISEKYKAIPYLMPLPAIFDNAELKQAISSDKNIAHTLELGQKAEIALFTVGSFNHESVLVKANYFDSNEVDDLIKAGAVGDEIAP